MSDHVERVKRAIEFSAPDRLPVEIVDAPGIYNAYHTLDPDTVELVPGTEDFDALWTSCYTWFHEEIGRTSAGEPLKRDQFGTTFRTPADRRSVYALLSHPLAGRETLAGYVFPDPALADPYFDKLGAVIRARYADRFVDGFVDPGIFLTTELLFGIQEFLLRVASDPDVVTEAYERVMDYYRCLTPKYQRAGAHMITVIEDIGGTSGLLIRPEQWRQRFRPITQRFIDAVHAAGLYAGLAIDGHSGDVLDDVLAMDVDVFSVFDIHTTGLETIRDKLAGKVCVKAAIDMQRTLPGGTPADVAREAEALVQAFGGPSGGFIAQIIRWHRPEFPAANVQASVAAFTRRRD